MVKAAGRCIFHPFVKETAMIRALFLAAALLLPAASWGQAHVQSLGWMAGSWEQAGPRERVTEIWTAPADGMMVGASLTTGAGRRSFEFMRIIDTPEGMSYLISPSGRSAVEYRLASTGDKRVVFENLGHEFPQRIIYWMDGDLLAARIEGNVRGEMRADEWKYRPVQTAATGGSGG